MHDEYGKARCGISFTNPSLRDADACCAVPDTLPACATCQNEWSDFRWRGQKLVLALPLRRAQGELRGQAFALVALSLLVTGAAGIGGWALVGKTLAPIGALALQARESAKSLVQLLEARAASPDLPR